MAGKFSYGTSSHTHGHPIDFINPDCHLLGKKHFTLIRYFTSSIFSSAYGLIAEVVAGTVRRDVFCSPDKWVDAPRFFKCTADFVQRLCPDTGKRIPVIVTAAVLVAGSLDYIAQCLQRQPTCSSNDDCSAMTDCTCLSLLSLTAFLKYAYDLKPFKVRREHAARPGWKHAIAVANTNEQYKQWVHSDTPGTEQYAKALLGSKESLQEITQHLISEATGSLASGNAAAAQRGAV